MLRFIAFVLALAMAHPAQAEHGNQLYVDAPRDGYLNLRSGPSTGYTVLERMPHGSRVQVLARPGKWLKLRHASGAIGWAHGHYLSQTPPRTTHEYGRRHWPDQNSHSPERLQVHAPAYGALNMRSGPGTGYAVVMRMYNGSTVEVLGQKGVWRLVKHMRSGHVGWAHGGYLAPRAAPMPRLVPHQGPRGHHGQPHYKGWRSSDYQGHYPGTDRHPLSGTARMEQARAGHMPVVEQEHPSDLPALETGTHIRGQRSAECTSTDNMADAPCGLARIATPRLVAARPAP